MALKATIYKADLNIANMDEHIYADYQLTLALHPSETIERLMVRILAYARYADEQLEFTKTCLKPMNRLMAERPDRFAGKNGLKSDVHRKIK